MKREGIRSLLAGAAASLFFLLLFLGLGWSFPVSLLFAVLLFAAVWLITKPERKGKTPAGSRMIRKKSFFGA